MVVLLLTFCIRFDVPGLLARDMTKLMAFARDWYCGDRVFIVKDVSFNHGGDGFFF